MNTKKASLGHFQMNEAGLWLSIKSAQQDGSDYLKLQKKQMPPCRCRGRRCRGRR
jgi:hypothetical protein